MHGHSSVHQLLLLWHHQCCFLIVIIHQQISILSKVCSANSS
jgi:hypothetical protein